MTHTASDLPHPLLGLAQAYPHRPFLNDLTAAELLKGVREAMSVLCERVAGVEVNELRDKRVGLLGAYDERWVCWALAINALGATLAPLKPEATQGELAQLSEALDLDERLEVSALEARLADHRAERLAPYPSPLPLSAWAWERPLFALTTSGTTGRPKPVLLTTRALTMSAFGSMTRLGHLPNDRWLACLPLHHVGGLSMLTRALLQQTALTLCPPTPRALTQGLLSGEYSLCSLTPTLLEGLLDELAPLAGRDSEALAPMRARLRVLLLGGARTPKTLWTRAEALNLPVRLTWGMSEAASQVCTQLSMAPPGGALPPLPFQSVSLTPEGALMLCSPTTERGTHLTSDLGALDENGWVQVTGRRDDVVISGGVNLHPHEIEERLAAHPFVGDVAVVGAPDERWGEVLIAHLTPRSPRTSPSTSADDERPTDGDRPTDDELRAWCRETLSRYKCPKRFVWHSTLPRDPLGKLRRHLLKDTSRPSPSAQTTPHEEPPL